MSGISGVGERGDREPSATTDPADLTPRGRRSRAALIEAARTVFGRDGFLDARVADISAEAGMGHGSFYTYFSSKEEIFREVIAAVQADMAAPPETPPASDDPYDRIQAANRQYIRAYQRNADLMATLEQVATFNDEIRELRLGIRTLFVERNSRAIARWQAAGLADPELDPRYAANALGSMVDRFVYTWLVLGEEFEEDLAVATLTRLWTQAIGLKRPARQSARSASSARSGRSRRRPG